MLVRFETHRKANRVTVKNEGEKIEQTRTKMSKPGITVHAYDRSQHSGGRGKKTAVSSDHPEL